MISWYVFCINGMYHSCIVVVYLGESIGTTLWFQGVRKPPMPVRQPPKAREACPGAALVIFCVLVVPCMILLGGMLWDVVGCCGHHQTVSYFISALSVALRRRQGRPSSRRRQSRRRQSRRLPCACRPRRKLVLTRRDESSRGPDASRTLETQESDDSGS